MKPQIVVLYVSKDGIVLDYCSRIETAISMRDSLPVEAMPKIIVHCSKHGIQQCEEEGCVVCAEDSIEAIMLWLLQ
jgi:hypothetical protein